MLHDGTTAGTVTTAPMAHRRPDTPPHGHDPDGALLSIGTELLFGEIVDTNAAYLAGEMARLGSTLTGTRQLGDERARIAAAFGEALVMSTWWSRPAAWARPTTT